MIWVCLYLKDLANRYSDLVLFYSLASHKSWYGLQLYFGKGTTLPREIDPRKMTHPPSPSQ